MIASGYTPTTLSQAVPKELTSQLKAHDVVVSRTRRVIRPNGSNTATGNSVLDFNVSSSSEWVDAKTLIFHATLNIDRVKNPAGADYHNPFPKAGWRSIFKGVNITCKGQSLETTQDSNLGLLAWNGLRSRIYEGDTKLKTGGQLVGGGYQVMTPNGAGTYLYSANRTTDASGVSTFEIALPLSQVVNFFGLDRSYIPIFAIPILLQMTMGTLQESFILPKAGVAGATFEYSNMYIAGDFLTMDSSVDESFRRMVMEGSVSFMYPSVYITQETLNGGNLQLKTNLNASNLDSVFFLASNNPTTSDDFAPCNSRYIFNKTTMSNVKYNLYIDSRNVFSEHIGNCSEAFDELMKAVKNENQQYLEDCPNITAQGYIQGIKKHTDIAANTTEWYGDVAYSVLAVNLSRVLSMGSISGVNVSLTGGRIVLELQDLNDNQAFQGFAFYKHTRELKLSADFLQVIQ